MNREQIIQEINRKIAEYQRECDEIKRELEEYPDEGERIRRNETLAKIDAMESLLWEII